MADKGRTGVSVSRNEMLLGVTGATAAAEQCEVWPHVHGVAYQSTIISHNKQCCSFNSAVTSRRRFAHSEFSPKQSKEDYAYGP
jgi:hypothetical protein